MADYSEARRDSGIDVSGRKFVINGGKGTIWDCLFIKSGKQDVEVIY